MIPVDISVALGIYLLLSVGIIAIFWLVSDSRRHVADLNVQNNRLWTCTLCLVKYVDSLAETFSRCPSCGNLNKKTINGK